jgi:nitroimidazol reductase NimA-like FMN-containing flavoprotein (pyridoxamine 5'-phosphate oxidase superfamily)
MRALRRKEKEITAISELKNILKSTKYITIAMCHQNEPYLVTLSHGYDEGENCIFFHCSKEGKKVDVLEKNPLVWGQAIMDLGYVKGKCDHLFSSVQFQGTVSFPESTDEKRHALTVMIRALEDNPQEVLDEQVTEKAVKRVRIGRIDIQYMSGKKSVKPIVQT